MTSLNFQTVALIDAMNDRPIAFNRHYVSLGCGINGALMLSQMVYWSKRTKDKNGYFYKTQDDWEQETGLTRREQETARKKLRELGFVSEHKHGVPCKVHFRVEHDNLYMALVRFSQNSQSSMAESAKLECTDAPNSDVVIRQTNTENTQEITTESIGAVAPRKHKFSERNFLLENGVSDQTASEYINLRKTKKKPITEKVIRLVLSQAKKANISNERAFEIIVAKGWDSFNATWNWQQINDELNQLNQSEQPKQSAPAPQNLKTVKGAW
ncbi:DNA-binding protein [Acinetobacter baumannii]